MGEAIRAMAKIDCNSYEARFIIYASVIDILARHSVYRIAREKNNDCTMTFYELKEKLMQSQNVQDLLKSFKDTQINEWMSELSWMGYVTRVSERETNSVIRLTGEGLQAYKDQSMQSIAANLLAARESRRLSIIAIIVAIVSIVVASLFAVLNFVCN